MSAVAKACGVNIMAVSRAFRKDGLIAPALRQRILDAAAQMNYHPNGRMGRPREQNGILRKQVRIILGEKTGAANLYHACLLGAIERTLAQCKYDCLLRTYDGSYKNFVWLCETLRCDPPLPTMIVGCFVIAQIRALLELCPDALLVDYTDNPHLSHPYNSAGFDNIEAARIMIRHLIESGRKRILLMKGHHDHPFSMDIEKGYREILLINGMEPDNTLIHCADFSAFGAYRRTFQLLDQKLTFDAVFTNDEMALGVMRALFERGKIMPDEVAVAGCDGLPYGQFTKPSLTTVIMDYNELGRIAARRVLAIHEQPGSPIRIRLVPKLEIRESTQGSRQSSTKINSKERGN